MRLALFISKKHRRSRNFGWRVMLASSPGELGLISLYGNHRRPQGREALAGKAECRR